VQHCGKSTAVSSRFVINITHVGCCFVEHDSSAHIPAFCFLGKGFLYQSQVDTTTLWICFCLHLWPTPRESLERVFLFFVAYKDQIPKRLDWRFFCSLLSSEWCV
jgi:hypothetical protein